MRVVRGPGGHNSQTSVLSSVAADAQTKRGPEGCILWSHCVRAIVCVCRVWAQVRLMAGLTAACRRCPSFSTRDLMQPWVGMGVVHVCLCPFLIGHLQLLSGDLEQCGWSLAGEVRCSPCTAHREGKAATCFSMLHRQSACYKSRVTKC